MAETNTDNSIDPIGIAHGLLACESVTPATGAVFDTLQAALESIGFTVTRTIDGADDPEPAHGGPVENLIAVRGSGGRHFGFAGHVDVVPPGDGWTTGAFEPEIRSGMLFGRGAVDMKGSIACFVAAAARVPEDMGTLSLIITGDEEGPAIHGTRAAMRYMAERNIVPELILVGEPSSMERLGDTMKIGRRGSVNMWISVAGTQGHVAYPHLADNPIPRLARIMAEMDALVLDTGTKWFQPSNLEITDIDCGNPASNVIPRRAGCRISIRFNDTHTGEELVAMIREIVERHGGALNPMISGEPFLTLPGEFSSLIADAAEAELGIRPEASTTGGTSDARFLSALCPVVEFGLVNATMHKLDEAVAVADLRSLTNIYERIIRFALG